jgi:peptidoglycan-associated lipoprotein
MNIFDKKLILAVTGALLLFSTGCVKKPMRPTPNLTAIPGGGVTNVVDTGPETVIANVKPDPSVITTTFYPLVEDLTPKPPAGDLFNGQLRNVPELQSIYFAFDRSAIEQKERVKFQAIKEYLSKNPQYRILFEGHCDWRGTAEYNMALGDRRANSARKYAVSIGIDPAKIDVKSMGSQKATERASDSVMANDRRAEIVVLVK